MLQAHRANYRRIIPIGMKALASADVEVISAVCRHYACAETRVVCPHVWSHNPPMAIAKFFLTTRTPALDDPAAIEVTARENGVDEDSAASGA
jgi:hypothetical protein